MMVEKIDEDSWNSFMARTDQAVKIINGLASDDVSTINHSLKKAEEILGRIQEGTEIVDDFSYVKADRTVINRNAPKDAEQNQNNMSPDAFMRHVEIDAANRAENRRLNKIESDRHMKQGNKAFKEKDFDKALTCYNKAIDVLKDRSILYLNRSLTLLKLGLCRRALKDTDVALRLNPTSLKGLMYKAEAHFMLGEYEDSEKAIQEACEAHPDNVKLIKDTEQKWKIVESCDESAHV